MKALAFLMLLIFIGIITINVGIMFYTDEIQITVTDKIVKNHSESSRYLIFTKDEVFQNTDSWIDLKVNSSDFYNKMKIDSTYNVKVRGVRIPLLSNYRNIVKIY